MANKHASLDALFTDIADVLRSKTGRSDLIPATEFSSVIRNELDAGSSVALISFTIDGTGYQAEEGMKWGDWCVSEYNTGGFEIRYTNGNIVQQDQKMGIVGVVADGVINQGEYALVEVTPVITFNIYDEYNGGTYTYEADEGMTWDDWCASSYNPGCYIIDGSNVLNTDTYGCVGDESHVYVSSGDLIQANGNYVIM